MRYIPKSIPLKNGQTAIFRSPSPADANEMLDYLKATAGETLYLMRYPEECTATVEQETAFLQNMLDSPDSTMIVCEIDGHIAGNCQFSRMNRLKTRHRASVAIALRKEYWNLGIGTAMFQEMIRFAQEQNGVEQLELEVIEGNENAMHLYEKMGFRVVGSKPNAIRLKDGSRLQIFYMIKSL